MKGIDADYYGYRDEDDGVIVPLEKESEEKGRGLRVSERSVLTFYSQLW